MSVAELMEWNKAHHRDDRLTMTLGMHCAPLLMKDKISNIITIDIRDFSDMKRLLKNTGISYRLLKSRGEKMILFLYRKTDLLNYLMRSDVYRFLLEEGYDGVMLPEHLINQLAKRIFFYGNGDIAFPHEIGVFLGYPLGDVRGFIENMGKNSLYSGYWKVYENVDATKALFERFEYDRTYVIHKIVSGYTLTELMDELEQEKSQARVS